MFTISSDHSTSCETLSLYHALLVYARGRHGPPCTALTSARRCSSAPCRYTRLHASTQISYVGLRLMRGGQTARASEVDDLAANSISLHLRVQRAARKGRGRLDRAVEAVSGSTCRSWSGGGPMWRRGPMQIVWERPTVGRSDVPGKSKDRCYRSRSVAVRQMRT